MKKLMCNQCGDLRLSGKECPNCGGEEINLKQTEGVERMRMIAEQAHEIVREFGGSVSGEHGDGLVRSEFIEPMQ